MSPTHTSPDLPVLVAGGGSFAAFERDVYQGNPACFSCHVQEAESWLISSPSEAFLPPTDSTSVMRSASKATTDRPSK